MRAEHVKARDQVDGEMEYRCAQTSGDVYVLCKEALRYVLRIHPLTFVPARPRMLDEVIAPAFN